MKSKGLMFIPECSCQLNHCVKAKVSIASKRFAKYPMCKIYNICKYKYRCKYSSICKYLSCIYISCELVLSTILHFDLTLSSKVFWAKRNKKKNLSFFKGRVWQNIFFLCILALEGIYKKVNVSQLLFPPFSHKLEML